MKTLLLLFTVSSFNIGDNPKEENPILGIEIKKSIVILSVPAHDLEICEKYVFHIAEKVGDKKLIIFVVSNHLELYM